MSYFNKESQDNKIIESDLTKIFAKFLDINDTEDRFKIHDNIIKAIRLVLGEFKPEYAHFIQEIIDLYFGEIEVPNNIINEPIAKINKFDTSEKFKKLKI